MYAQAGTVGLDALMPVIRSVERQERWLPKPSVAEWAISVGHHVFKSCVSVAADLAIWGVRRGISKIETNALLIEGAKGRLLKALVEQSVDGPRELLEPLQKLHSSSLESIQEGEELVARLRSFNPQSRLASEIERANCLVASIVDNATAMIQLVLEGQTHADVLAEMRRVNLLLNHQLLSYDEDQEFSPELVALAEQAIERISDASQAFPRR